VLKKRSVMISGHRTSVALELEFWTVLEKEASGAHISFAQLIVRIDRERGDRPLASALRLHALASVRRGP